MIKRFENYSLKEHQTFGLNVNAKYYFEYSSSDELLEVLSDPIVKKHDCLLLGGGSNLLFIKDFEGVVLHSAITGIKVVIEDHEHVIVKVGAGVEWDFLVEWSVNNNLGGIENLSFIPGDVGAAPVQNIGAYGVEFKDVFVKAEGFYINRGRSFSIDKEDCALGYRDSVFKNKLKNKVIITTVYLRLNKNPKFLLHYGKVNQAIADMGGVSLKNVRQAIINIRKEKLPDPKIYGNAGSFFKNPIVKNSMLDTLRKDYPDIPFYDVPGGNMKKIPAGCI